MNLFLEPEGFLGTGASLLADLTLLAYLLLIMPALIIGVVFVRRGLHRPHHKWAMIIVTVVNWVLIIFLMLAAYATDVAPNLPQQPGNPRYFLPAIHGLLGLPAQLLATFIVVRMLIEDHQVARARQRGETDLQKYWFRAARSTMWIVLVLWLLTTILGFVSYIVRYNVLAVPGGDVPAPAATPEISITQEAAAPPGATEEPAAPAITPEAQDDDAVDDDDNDTDNENES